MKCKHYLKAAAGHYRSASDKPWMTFRWRADGCPRRVKVQFKWPHSHRYYPGCYFAYLHLKTYVVDSQWKSFIVTLPMKPRLMFLINNKPKISQCVSLENHFIWKYWFPHRSSRRLCVLIWHKYNGIKEEYFLHDGAVLL